jgi:hypothetical protein
MPTSYPQQNSAAVQASATLERSETQKTPEVAPIATLEALPTIDATKAALINEIESANARAELALEKLDQQNAEIYKSLENAARDNKETAKYNASQAASEKWVQAEITQQMRIENERLALAAESESRSSSAKHFSSLRGGYYGGVVSITHAYDAPLCCHQHGKRRAGEAGLFQPSICSG